MLKILQINVHHCVAASAALSAYIVKQDIDIALIQEPWIHKGKIKGLSIPDRGLIVAQTSGNPRTCIVAKHVLNLMPLWDLCSRDLVVAKVGVVGEGARREIILGSGYLPHDQQGHPPTEEIQRLIINGTREPLILGCDANAHHMVWGSTDINSRGEKLLEFILESNLEIMNKGNEPTFVNAVRGEVIDLTLANRKASDLVKKWHVSAEPTLSDHRYIRFDIESEEVTTLLADRNPRKTDWDLYNEVLVGQIRDCPRKARTTHELELMTDIVVDSINTAFQASCPAIVKRTSNKVTWWNRGLDEARTRTRKLFNIAKRNGDWDSYRTSLTAYNNAIKKAKRDSWRRFCGEVENEPTCSRLQKALSKDHTGNIGSLRTEDGRCTETVEDTLQELLQKHFPNCARTENPTSKDLDPCKTAMKRDWEEAKKIITPERVEWGINEFKPFKSPGTDGIYPVMLQKGLAVLRHPLCEILRASLALSHIPTSWRNVRVVFIPKPGRPTYALAKSYRPISLTSFIQKLLEKIVDRHIRDGALKAMPLHRYQYAYQSGKSCEMAVHELVSRCKKTLRYKEIALGAFLDIEGAFDNTTFASITAAMEKRGLSPLVRNWVNDMLKSRTVITTLQGTTVRATVTRGCPQGGVLSPLLWCLVIDGLIQTLEDMGVSIIGYADDITILVSGKFGATVCYVMQRALNTVERWCIKEGLSVNPSKTAIVPFTRRRKTGDIKDLKMYGVTLPMKKEVKYLGVTLDTKLTFQTHVNNVTTKATRALFATKAMVGRSWGLTPSMTKWLYTAVIRPTITYGAMIWGEKATQRSTMLSLGKVQRCACLLITGAMRTTPTAAMEIMLSLPPLHLVVMTEARVATYRMEISEHNVDLGLRTRAINGSPEETTLSMRSDFMKTYRVKRSFDVKIPSKDEWNNNNKLLDKGIGTIWYTDGAKNPQGVGAGIYGGKDQDSQISLILGVHASVFQAEVAAIDWCAKHIVNKGTSNGPVTIVTDSQAALKAISSPAITSRLVMDCIDSLEELAKNKKVRLVWVPRDQGLEGNLRADQLAKKGAKGTLVGPEPTFGISYETGKEIIRSKLAKDHLKEWKNSKGMGHSKLFLTGPTITPPKEIIHISRTKLRRITGLITGHCNLNKHMHRLGIKTSPLCRGCLEEDETPVHLLSECEAYNSSREAHFDKQKLSKEELSTIPWQKILDFMQETDLLQE